MSKVLNLLKWSATLGKDEQNFLGARWIPAFLKKVPQGSRRKWALRILDLSPHYFLSPDDPKYKGMSKDEYLEAVFTDSTRSREDIWNEILADRIGGARLVIDYGCGPGFLTKAVSHHVEKVWGVDISDGALACARVVNSGDNITYAKADEEGLAAIPDGSVDAVCTFAVLQHLTDEVAAAVLVNISKKLKPGGKVAAHVQLRTDTWKSEADWRSDTSVKGKLKFKYGLHCFGRTREEYAELFRSAELSDPVFEAVKDMVAVAHEPLDGQFMATAVKL
jgi:SAM-dependent methyltransferase